MDKDVQKVGKKLGRLGSDLTKGLTLPILAAGTALVATAWHVGKFADELLSLVEKTGLSSATLQEFRHVARIAGIQTDALAEAAIKLTSKLSSGGEQTKELTGALAKLGLKATDANGRLIPMDVLLAAIIAKLQGMTDITLRNTIAADIFGKSWSEIAPVLGMSASAMAAARAEAQALGLVMSKDALEAADKFRIKLDTLKATVGALTNQIGVVMLPVTEKLVGVLQKDAAPAVRDLIKWFDELSPATKTAIGVVFGLTAAIGPLFTVIATLSTSLPLLRILFAALTGPIGLVVLAIGALGAAGFQMVKHWDAVQLQFTLAWAAMKDAVFFAVDKILSAVAGMAMAFKMTGLAAKIIELGAELRVLADQHLAKAGGQIAALEMKLDKTATTLTKVTQNIVKMGAALDALPSINPMSLIPLDPGFADASVGFGSEKKKSGFGFNEGDSMGTKISQTLSASGGGGQVQQMVQAFAAFGPLAVLLPVINGALESLEPVIVALIEPLVEIGRTIGDTLAPVLQMLVPVIQLVADGLMRQLAPMLKGLTVVISYVMEAFGWLVRAIGRLVDSLPGISAKGVINAGQDMIDAAKAARRNADATDTATDAVNSFSSALSNIPRVLNVNALRHMVTGAGGGGNGGGGTGGGGPTGPRGGGPGGHGPLNLYGDVNITVPGAGDPVAVAEAVGRVIQRSAARGGTSRIRLAVT